MTGGANGDLSPSSTKTRGENVLRDSSEVNKEGEEAKKDRVENELIKAENFSRLKRFEKIKVRY